MKNTTKASYEDRIAELLKTKGVASKDIPMILKAIPQVLSESDKARKSASRFSECKAFFVFLSELKTLESVKIAAKGGRAYAFESSFILGVFERMLNKFKATEAEQLFRLYQTFSGLDGGDLIASHKITRILRQRAFNDQVRKEKRISSRELRELSGNIMKIAEANDKEKKEDSK